MNLHESMKSLNPCQRYLSRGAPIQALVRGEDGNLWITVDDAHAGSQKCMGVNFDQQGRDMQGRGKALLATDSFHRYRREISDAADAISEVCLAIQHGTETSQDLVQKHSIDFMPHQLRPLSLFQGDAGREALLIADEVGTGKTYAAGLILHNGLMEGKIRRALVMCPKSIESKWHSTLSREFRIKCSTVSSGRRLLSWLEGDTNGVDVLVSSFDKARATLEDGTKIIDKMEEMLREGRASEIDLVIFDEVHRVIGRSEGTLRRRLAQIISLCSSSRVGLTATPVWSDASDIREISEILRPLVVSNSDIDSMISQQSRFTVAVNSLKQENPDDCDLQEALDGLSGTDLGDLQEAFDNAIGMNSADRTELGLKLGGKSPFASWITRTRANEVGKLADRIVADADLVDLDDSPGQSFYDEATDTVQTIESEREMVSEIEGMLNHSPHLLQLSSSPSSFNVHLTELLDSGMIEDNFAERARILANRLSSSPIGSKESKLIEILEEIIPRRRGAVVFTNWQPTFDRLTGDALNLRSKVPGITLYKAHYSDEELRESQVKRFRTHSDPDTFPVLVATSIMQEGRDLQDSADCVIHYDLPSNPQAVEQRIGRVDRIGQVSETVEVRYLILRGFAEHRFLLGMVAKIAEFEANVGSMRPILPDGIGSSGGGQINSEMRETIERWNLRAIADLDLSGFRQSIIPSEIDWKVPREISDLSRKTIHDTMELSLPPGSMTISSDCIVISPPSGNPSCLWDPIKESSQVPHMIRLELQAAANKGRRVFELRTYSDGLPIYKNLRSAFLGLSIRSRPEGGANVVVCDSLGASSIEVHEIVRAHQGGSSSRWIAISHGDSGPEELRISEIKEILVEASERGQLQVGSQPVENEESSSILSRISEEMHRSEVVWDRQRILSSSRRKLAIASRLESEGVSAVKVQELREQAEELRIKAEELDNRRPYPDVPSLRLVLIGGENG